MDAEENMRNDSSRKKLSYKAMLTCIIPGAFEKAFYFEKHNYDDIEEEVDELPEGQCIKILFSREEKLAMRKSHALTSL